MKWEIRTLDSYSRMLINGSSYIIRREIRVFHGKTYVFLAFKVGLFSNFCNFFSTLVRDPKSIKQVRIFVNSILDSSSGVLKENYILTELRP